MNEELRKDVERSIIESNTSQTLPKLMMKNEICACNFRHTAYVGNPWQASREAMKPIRLPKTMKNTQEQSCYYYNDAIDECKEAIQQAGYKVAP